MEDFVRWRRRRKKAAFVLLFLTHLRRTKSRWETRSVWAQPWLLRRESISPYDCLMKELQTVDTGGNRNFYRIDHAAFEELLFHIQPSIERRETNMRIPITAAERLAVTLRYLVTGETFASLSYLFRIGRTTTGGIVPEVCAALYESLQQQYMKIPSSAEEWKEEAKQFENKWNFPNCLGALDGKHMAFTAPPNSRTYFCNDKGHFSIVLLALVDANYKFLYIDVGCNGRISDEGALRESSLHTTLSDCTFSLPDPKELPMTTTKVPYVVAGDEASPLGEHLLKPYPSKNLDIEKRVFNYRLSRAQRTSKNAFEILSQRFRIFQTKLTLDPKSAVKITRAACVLHNFLCEKSSTYLTGTATDSEDAQDGEWRIDAHRSLLVPIPIQDSNSGSQHARDTRDKYKDYFMNEGQVQWQWDRV